MGNVSYWASHDYYRHSVDRDVVEFCGWDKLDRIFESIKDSDIRDACITAFLLAGRISEVLSLKKRMFVLEDKEIKVYNYPVLKRWKSVDLVLICTRCGLENLKYDTICKQCKANLLYSARKKHITQKVPTVRRPFSVPMKERFAHSLAKRVKDSKDLLFPSPKLKEKPMSRVHVYRAVKQLGYLVGLTSENPHKNNPNLYLHWFRSQRLMQLGNEYGLNHLELKAFTGIVLTETLDRYAKLDQSARKKMGIN